MNVNETTATEQKIKYVRKNSVCLTSKNADGSAGTVALCGRQGTGRAEKGLKFACRKCTKIALDEVHKANAVLAELVSYQTGVINSADEAIAEGRDKIRDRQAVIEQQEREMTELASDITAEVRRVAKENERLRGRVASLTATLVEIDRCAKAALTSLRTDRNKP